MNCNDVREKLPEYIAGVLDENMKMQVESHLKTCITCSEELKALSREITFDDRQTNAVDEKKILRKTKAKFKWAIVRTVALIMGILLLLSMIPNILWGIQAAVGHTTATRALMDFVQFSQPNKVNMWGDSGAQGLTLSVPLKIGALSVVGRKYGSQAEFTGYMSVVSGKVTVPRLLGTNFVHPDLFKGIDFGRERSVDVQTKVLEKNAETTVATVDYSLNKLIGLPEVKDLIGKYDIDVCWMAVEAGIEAIKPKNMNFGNQQMLQWGIPGKLSTPGNFDYAQLSGGTAKEFEAAVMEELKWLDGNKQVLKPDSSLLKYNGIDSSVKEQAQYIIKNGIKIYGLRVTGPSNEILKLTGELNARTMSVVDMDFWNW